MRVLDPGHVYELAGLDIESEGRVAFHGSPESGAQRLVFVKREGEGYPGNVGSHPGTTMQEVLRALIDRAEYVNGQIPSPQTRSAITLMKGAVHAFEVRAALRHGRPVNFGIEQAVRGPTCEKCGHVGCEGTCHL